MKKKIFFNIVSKKAMFSIPSKIENEDIEKFLKNYIFIQKVKVIEDNENKVCVVNYLNCAKNKTIEKICNKAVDFCLRKRD